jgi:arabinose-5-phosphate isomerase
MNYLERGHTVFDVEIAAIRHVASRLDDAFARAIETIRTAVERKNKVVVVGVGKSGHIGEKIAATLTSTGAPAVVLNSLNALHGDLGVVADGDVILALSYSGETEELNRIIPALARFDVTLIALTGNPNSFLASHSAITLDVAVPEEACPLKLAPTSSTTAMLVLGDALAMVLLEARGFNKEDFARYHPGGSLGRSLLLKVSDIMRPPDRMARVTPAQSVRETLVAMAKARAGAAVVIGPDASLSGIFTHGDFGRHFQSDPELLDKPIGDHMTRSPITVRADRLAVDVLQILERHPIDDLVVLDDLGRPAGIVDSQDLARFKLL